MAFTYQAHNLIPHSLQQQLDHWQHWDGICRVDDEPPTEPPPAATAAAPDDIAKLSEALRKERELRSQYERTAKEREKQLEVYAGIDPDKAKKAEQILKEMEERNQWESKIRAEAEAQYQPRLSEYEKQLQEKDQALINFQRDTALKDAFYKMGGFEGEFDAVAHGLRGRVQIDATGQIKVLDEKGQPMYHKGDPATLAHLIDDMKAKQVWFARHFRSSDKNGFGIHGSGQQVPGAALEGLSPWEKVARMREAQGKA